MATNERISGLVKFYVTDPRLLSFNSYKETLGSRGKRMKDTRPSRHSPRLSIYPVKIYCKPWAHERRSYVSFNLFLGSVTRTCGQWRQGTQRSWRLRKNTTVFTISTMSLLACLSVSSFVVQGRQTSFLCFSEGLASLKTRRALQTDERVSRNDCEASKWQHQILASQSTGRWKKEQEKHSSN